MFYLCSICICKKIYKTSATSRSEVNSNEDPQNNEFCKQQHIETRPPESSPFSLVENPRRDDSMTLDGTYVDSPSSPTPLGENPRVHGNDGHDSSNYNVIDSAFCPIADEPDIKQERR
jgi:hypothetical protein